MAKTTKEERERRVLMALIEHYIKSGKPVGSHTLKESGIEEFSSATIRNYFANLEKEGYLTQQHSSGGRVPTNQGYRLYAAEQYENTKIAPESEFECQKIRATDSKEIATSLQWAAETLSRLTNTAVFLSAPRFDHDYLVAMRLVAIDHGRYLCILVTDFGVIKTELVHIEKKMSSFALKRIEEYFHWRLTGLDRPEQIDGEEEMLGQKIYNEVVVRYIVGYSNFIDEDVYRTGFSKLIAYPEFQEATLLASSLSLFENTHTMRLLLKECCALDRLKYWIGNDLAPYAPTEQNCTILILPYHINKQAVGAIGLLGPTRIPYGEFFGLLRGFSASISEALTRNIFKFKIKYRQPQEKPLFLEKGIQPSIRQSTLFLEDLRVDSQNL